jgi:hypothetical protein
MPNTIQTVSAYYCLNVFKQAVSEGVCQQIHFTGKREVRYFGIAQSEYASTGLFSVLSFSFGSLALGAHWRKGKLGTGAYAIL